MANSIHDGGGLLAHVFCGGGNFGGLVMFGSEFPHHDFQRSIVCIRGSQFGVVGAGDFELRERGIETALQGRDDAGSALFGG